MVPLDGSALSAQALALAGALAKRTGAELDLVHVHVPIAFAYAGVAANGAAINTWEIDTQQRKQETEYLASEQKRIADETGLVVTQIVLDGPVVESLVTHAAENRRDLIVMSTHGRGPLVRVWLGSVTDGVLRRATTPLLIIRPHEELRVPAHNAAFCNVLIPLDGSDLAEQVIDVAMSLTCGDNVSVTLLRVVEPYMLFDAVTLTNVPVIDHEETIRREEEATEYLNEVSRRIEATGAHVETRVLVGEQPAATILEDAQEGTYDLIALSTHGLGGMKRLLIGSAADKLVRGGHCPMLVVRPTVAATEPE
jgi:nucleotide-binding universal stress UspA family protein